MKSTLFKQCICYRCRHHTANHSPDCACDNGPVYDQEACTHCTKRHFCDVTKQPWLYQPEEDSPAEIKVRRSTKNNKQMVGKEPQIRPCFWHGSCGAVRVEKKCRGAECRIYEPV
jgi:hypothetical protein